jgi:hypothetical protein
MSDPAHSPGGRDTPSPYAPKWACDPAYRRRRGFLRKVYDRDLAQQNTAEESIGTILARAGQPLGPERAGQPLGPERDDDHLRMLRLLDPEVVPDPTPAPRKDPSQFGVVSILSDSVSALAAAALVALFLVGKVPPSPNVTSDSTGDAILLASSTEAQTFETAEAPVLTEPPVTPAAENPTSEPTTSGMAARDVAGTEVRELDRDEIAILRKRGEEFVLAGDIAGARLLLRRAAEARDAHAALALGATYDPNMLAKLRVHGLTADIAAARTWYEKAAELGSAEASERIKRLPTHR